MKDFIAYMRIVKKNNGLLYYYENNGYVYSPCRDLYGEPICNFRLKDKNGKEIYGKELSNKDRNEIKRIKGK